MEEDIEKVLEESEFYEPQVTSSDPEERKAARRLRIQRRLENIRRQALQQEGIDETEKEVEELTPVQKQLEKSAELLQKLIIDGEEHISNVRVANDSREVDRREVEGIEKEKIFEELEEEAKQAEEMYNKIANRWAGVLEYNDPLAINDEIQSQKDKCDELIKQKDAVILHLKEELRTAEINFTNDQRKQVEDINTLTQRIERQVIIMRQAYRQELLLVEEMILLERRLLMEANDKKWDELFKKREEEEIANSKRIFEILEEFFEDSTRLRHEQEELFRATKIRLERDIEMLQQELARIKALCLLNSEKLDYNYQILRKREDENIIIKSQQKRRINKLQDIINTLCAKISDYETSTDNEIKKLNFEVQKLKKGIDDTEAKTEHFSEVNMLKYKQIWDLNLRRAVEILDKILSIDKVIHEQQLGIEWKSPDLTFLRQQFDVEKLHRTLFVGKYFKGEEKKDNEVETESPEVSKTIEEVEMDDETSRIDQLKLDRLLKLILDKISDKTEFLVEARLLQILKPYAEDQRTLVRVDNVFMALGINTREDVDLLVKYFVPYAYCPVCSKNPDFTGYTKDSYDSSPGEDIDDEPNIIEDKDLISATRTAICAVQHPEGMLENILEKLLDTQESTDSESEDEGEIAAEKIETSESVASSINITTVCPKNHPLMITSVYVLRALRDFVSKFFVLNTAKPSLTLRIAKRREIMNTIEEKNVEPFFNKFRDYIDPAKQQLWDGLLIGLQKYHIILKSRKTVHEEVQKLRRQNEELKHLLASYIQSHATMDPPCAANREVPYMKSPLAKLFKKYH